MARQCGDCYYRLDECCQNHDGEHEGEHYREHVYFNQPACSDFVPDGPSCCECYYFEFEKGVHGYGYVGGKCNKKNKCIGDRSMIPPACSSFIRG